MFLAGSRRLGSWLTLTAASAGLFCCNAPTDDGLYNPYSGSGGGGQAGAAGSSSGGAGAGGMGGTLPEAGAGEGGGGTGGQPAGAGGEGLDAGADARADAGDAESEAGLGCAGTTFGGVCWYLGAEGESCSQACMSHGGFDEAALAQIGAVAQGGSLEQCDAILTALTGEQNTTTQGTNIVGVGCHLFGESQDRWWLESPDFSPDSVLDSARLACGCRQ